MCTLWLTYNYMVFWSSDMEAVSTQTRTGWAKDSENGENVCLLKSHFPRWGGAKEDRNLALLCLVASGGITAGAPGLQDDSALSSLCLLWEEDWFYSLSCDCVMSVNWKKEATQMAKKRSFKAVRCGTSTRHQLYFILLLRPEEALVFSGWKLWWRRGEVRICLELSSDMNLLEDTVSLLSFIPRFPLPFSSLQPAAEIVSS